MFSSNICSFSVDSWSSCKDHFPSHSSFWSGALINTPSWFFRPKIFMVITGRSDAAALGTIGVTWGISYITCECHAALANHSIIAVHYCACPIMFAKEFTAKRASVWVEMAVCLCVSPATGWGAVQGVPRLSPHHSWDRKPLWQKIIVFISEIINDKPTSL